MCCKLCDFATWKIAYEHPRARESHGGNWWSEAGCSSVVYPRWAPCKKGKPTVAADLDAARTLSALRTSDGGVARRPVIASGRDCSLIRLMENNDGTPRVDARSQGGSNEVLAGSVPRGVQTACWRSVEHLSAAEDGRKKL